MVSVTVHSYANVIIHLQWISTLLINRNNMGNKEIITPACLL